MQDQADPRLGPWSEEEVEMMKMEEWKKEMMERMEVDKAEWKKRYQLEFAEEIERGGLKLDKHQDEWELSRRKRKRDEEGGEKKEMKKDEER